MEPYSALATNNVAEYTAVLKALEKAKELGLVSEEIEVLTDSKLLANQLNGQWKVKAPHIVHLNVKAKALMQCFPMGEFSAK